MEVAACVRVCIGAGTWVFWASAGQRDESRVRERLSVALAASTELLSKAEAPDEEELRQVQPRSTAQEEANSIQ